MDKIIRNLILLSMAYIALAIIVEIIPFDISPLFNAYVTPLMGALITGFGLGLGFYLAKTYFENKK